MRGFNSFVMAITIALCCLLWNNLDAFLPHSHRSKSFTVGGNYRRRVPSVRLYEQKGSKPNLLSEEIKEFREGIREFQESTFKEIYGEDVAWKKTDSDTSENLETTENALDSEIPKETDEDTNDSTTAEPKKTVDDADKIIEAAAETTDQPDKDSAVSSAGMDDKEESVSTDEKKETKSVVEDKKEPPVVKEKKEASVVEDKKEPPVVDAKETPVVEGTMEVKEIVVEEKEKRPVVKPAPSPVPAPKPVVKAAVKKDEKDEESGFGKLFGFLKSDPAVDALAKSQSPTAPPSVAQAFQSKPVSTPSPDTSLKKPPVVKKPSETAKAALIEEKPTTPVVKQEEARPVVKPAPSPVPAPKPVVKAAVKKDEKDEESGFGKLFGFLKSDPAVDALAQSKPVSSSVEKGAVSAKVSTEKSSEVSDSSLSDKVNAVKEAATIAKDVKPAKVSRTSESILMSEVDQDEEIEKQITTDDILKAQQAVAKSFLSLSREDKLSTETLTEAKPVVKPEVTSAAKVEEPKSEKKQSGGGLFGMFGTPVDDEPMPKEAPKPAVVAKKSPAPKVALKKAVPTPKAVSKPEVTAAAKVEEPKSEKKQSGGGLFGMFGTPFDDEPMPKEAPKPAVVAKKSPAPKVALKKAVPTPKAVSKPEVTAAAKVEEPKSEKKQSGRGLFGMFGTPVDEKPKPKEAPKPAVVAKKSPAPKVAAPKATVSKAAVKKAVPTSKAVSKPAVTAAAKVEEPKSEKKQSGGGLFGMFGTPVDEKPKPKEAPKPAGATSTTTSKSVVNKSAALKDTKTSLWSSGKNSATKTGNSSVAKLKSRESSIPKPVVKNPFVDKSKQQKEDSSGSSATEKLEKKPASPGGMFGLFGGSDSSNPKSTKSAPAPQPVATSMNKKFQTTVSKVLKGNSAKIKDFQKATDGYRSGSFKASLFVDKIDKIFGKENMDLIIPPLVSELPEKDLSKALKTAYDSYLKKTETKASSSSRGGLFGFAKSEEQSKGNANAPEVKVPKGVPASKKKAVEAQLKSLVAGKVDAKSFYSTITKELGKAKAKAIIPELKASLPKDIAAKVSQVAASS